MLGKKLQVDDGMVENYRVSRFPGANVQRPSPMVGDFGWVLLRLQCTIVVLCLCDRGTGSTSVGQGKGKWLKCRSILFFGFFASYQPQTCDDDHSGV